MTMTRKEAERQEFVEKLREILKPGDVLYTTVSHVSRSGMSRVIDVHQIVDNQPRCLSFWVAKATEHTIDKRNGGVRIGGCGMDMGFALVYQVSQALFPTGFECIGEGCPSNDHVNGDRDYSPHHHHSGGYAIRQRWM
jgi:hypothetical protein